MQIHSCLHAGVRWHLNQANKHHKEFFENMHCKLFYTRISSHPIPLLAPCCYKHLRWCFKISDKEVESRVKAWHCFTPRPQDEIVKSFLFTFLSLSESSPSQPQYVFWYHNERMVNYDKERGVRYLWIFENLYFELENF